MDEPQRFHDANRRHPHVSHEELRRQLLAADEERYRLRHQVRAPHASPWTRLPPARRRVAVGLGTILMTALVGGLAWEMCPSSARASESRPVRVVTTEVTPHVIVGEAPPAKVEKVQLRTQVPVRMSSKRLSGPPSRAEVRRASAFAPGFDAGLRRDKSVKKAPTKPVPRPLSPGEFGRPRVAS
jgi:hypothetical protein